jgi:hypothetical protein
VIPGVPKRRPRTASPGSRLEYRACQSRRRSGAWLVSLVLHVLVLGLLVTAGGLEPALPALEVFTELERDPATSASSAPQPRTVVASAKPRPARSARSLPPPIEPAVPKTAAQGAAMPAANVPVREDALETRPIDGDSVGLEHVELASGAVPALTLTPAKTLTATTQPSDATGELSAESTQALPPVARAAVVPRPVDVPERAAPEPERPHKSTAQLSPAESPTESSTNGTPDVPNAAPARSPSVATVTAQATNERSDRPSPEAMARSESRSSGPNAPIRVVITGPADGYTVSSSDPPLVVVQGEVDDPSVSAVSLIAGAQRFSVPVTAGRFRHAVPVLEPTVRVRVETAAIENRVRGSATITVHGAPTPTMALVLYRPDQATVPVDVAADWRRRSDRVDDTVQRISLGVTQETTGLTIYYLRNPQPGVYTFVLTSTATDIEPVQPALHVPGHGGGLKILPAANSDGTQRRLVARVLLPQGVLWEQNDWFSGQSANGNIVTKFRFPDGVSWSERAGGFR